MMIPFIFTWSVKTDMMMGQQRVKEQKVKEYKCGKQFHSVLFVPTITSYQDNLLNTSSDNKLVKNAETTLFSKLLQFS